MSSTFTFYIIFIYFYLLAAGGRVYGSLFNQHFNDYHTPIRHVCQQCGSPFSTASSLTWHNRKARNVAKHFLTSEIWHNISTTTTLLYDTCVSPFSTASSLIRHNKKLIAGNDDAEENW